MMKNKKTLWACMVAVGLALAVPQSVYAGELNTEEQRVLQEAGQVFTYQGDSYQAAPEYLLKLQNYLMRDDVDLSSADADAAIQEGYANVERGVLEGYLLPLSPEPPVEEVPPTPPTETEEQQPEKPTEPGQSEESEKPDETGKPEQPEKPTEPEKPEESEQPENPTESEKPEETEQPEESEETQTPEDSTTLEESGKPTEPDRPEEPGNTGDKTEGKPTDGVIKNTGYSLRGYVWTAAFILFGTVILLIAVYRFEYLHGREERS